MSEPVIPIPEDVRPGPGWTQQMLEMAAHIGAYDTLRVVERFGGRDVYIPVDAERNPMRELLGAEKAEIMSRVYRREMITIPTARSALSRARRAPVIAAIRARRLTVAAAARILHTTRTYVSHLVNTTTEGSDAEPVVLPDPGRRLPGQIEMFDLSPEEAPVR